MSKSMNHDRSRDRKRSKAARAKTIERKNLRRLKYSGHSPADALRNMIDA